MKPGFALLLSDERLSLLHRTDGGWAELGGTTFDTPDFADSVARLREQAEEISPEGFTTALVIPASQILYTSVVVDSDDEAAIRAALDGRTPYDVNELVFDSVMVGNEAQLAVVARDTLDEAEGFAAEHDLNPLCFVAEFQSEGAAWFGPTMIAPKLLKGAELEREPAPIRATVFAAEEPVAEPELAVTPEPPVEEPVAVEPEETPEPDPTPEEPAIESLPVEEPAPEPAAEVIEPEPVEPEAFEPEPEAPRAPIVPATALPVFDHPSFEEKRKAPEPLRADRAAQQAEPPRAPVVEEAPFVNLSPPPVTGDLTPPPLRAEASPSRLSAMRPVAKKAEAPKNAKPARMEPGLTRQGEVPKVERPKIERDRPRTDPFGTTPQKGKPKFLGLILTVALLVLLAVVAAVSSYYIDRTAEDQGAEALGPPEIVAAEAPPPDAAPEAAVLETAVAEATETPAPATEVAAAAAPETAPDQPTDAAPVEEVAITLEHPPAPEADDTAAALETAAADTRPDVPAPPAPFGTTYEFDADGRIVPTSDGVITPEGITLVAGKPVKVPPARPVVEAAVVEAVVMERPRSRPEGLAAPEEEAAEDLADLEEAIGTSVRPPSRSEDVISFAEAMAREDAAAASLVTAAPSGALEISLRPEQRPSGISRDAVRAALTAAMTAPPEPAPAPQPQRVAAAQQATIRTAQPTARTEVEADDEPEIAVAAAPRIPTRASVAQNATVTRGLDLGRMNLIGISGSSSNRVALIRQSNGRIGRVRVGDRVDGGVVAQITSDAVHYQKGGRMLALQMPRG